MQLNGDEIRQLAKDMDRIWTRSPPRSVFLLSERLCKLEDRTQADALDRVDEWAATALSEAIDDIQQRLAVIEERHIARQSTWWRRFRRAAIRLFFKPKPDSQ